MKIAVIGPGALGCLLAASLACRSAHAVHLLDHDPERAARLAQLGILLEEGGNIHQCRLTVSADAKQIGTADLVLLCVKSHAVPSCLAQAADLFSDQTILLAFQNGIGHIAPLAEQLHTTCWGLGVTAQGATLVAPNHVRHGGSGLTRIGLLDAAATACPFLLDGAATALTLAGFETVVVPDIMTHIWAKLLVNAGINALTAILGCSNGGLLALPAAKAKLIAAVTEAAAVARAKGIPLACDPVTHTLEVCRATSGNLSSMLQDVRRKRRTEIDAINGAVVAEARRYGIPVPVNEELVSAIKEIEQSY